MGGSGTSGRERTILLDLRVCQVNRERGIPVYTQSLQLELPTFLPEARFLLWHDPELPPPVRSSELEAAFGPFRSAKELQALPRTERITDLFTSCFFVPYKDDLSAHLFPTWLRAHQPRRLGVVYDLIPFIFHRAYLKTPATRGAYAEGLRCLRTWDQLFCISESAREDTIRYAGVAPSRVQNIYGGLDPAKARAIASGGTAWKGRPLPDAYAIYVGGDDWRKNMEGTVRAFAEYLRRGGRIQALVLACNLSLSRQQDFLRLGTEAGLPDGALVVTGHVTDEELVSLVKGATLSLFPSFYEGLGLPVLESYACGTPVLASDRSSLPELVPPACRFDPSEPRAIAEAMLAFDRDPSLASQSLAFGQQVLKDLTWTESARRLAQAAFGQPRPCVAPAAAPVAMIGVLPPARTGIARFNAEYLRLPHTPVHFFSALSQAIQVRDLQPVPWQRFAHPRNLLVLQEQEGYAQRLYVFGNSGHHQATLDALRSMREVPGQTWLHLHDADVLGLWLADLHQDLDAVHGLYARSYPEWRGSSSDLLSRNRPKGLRPLLELGHEVGIIVHSEWARKMVLEDLGAEPSLGVHVLFHPVASHEPMLREADDVLRLGSFGKPEKAKQMDRVVAAAKLLAKRRPTRLLVAGYDAERFLSREGLRGSHLLEVLDSPSDEALLDAMRSVDVAVQLRFPSHGESSGAISHLLGLGKPLVATGSGSFAELGSAAVLVEPDVTAEGLAQAILLAHESGAHRQALLDYRQSHSAEAFQARLEAVLAARR